MGCTGSVCVCVCVPGGEMVGCLLWRGAGSESGGRVGEKGHCRRVLLPLGVWRYMWCVLACVGSLNVCKCWVNAQCVIPPVHILYVAHAL
jgi:hypothetical protein